jgi:subtilisin family serine protease
VVANIDSGVRWTHEALRDNYRGFAESKEVVNHDYAMWDAESREYTPDNVDIFGHGSHTMGTLAGAGPNSIGMAPGATWIQAKAFNWDGESKQSDLLSAAQWVMCPSKYDLTEKDCSKGADIVSCSFGGDAATQSWLNPSVSAWRAAGMLPVFAAGNVDNAMQCESIMCAACSDDAIAVGGVSGKTLYRASGKGPNVNGTIKPDFVAPAKSIKSICSAADDGTSGYMRLTGTSMATPHVAGALALALGAARKKNANASGEDALAALRATTDQGMTSPVLAASDCGGTPWNVYPNNIYGWGEPNVCLAVNTFGTGLSCDSAIAI